MADSTNSEGCYPQRPAVPKTEQAEPTVREHAGTEACKKQYEDAGWN